MMQHECSLHLCPLKTLWQEDNSLRGLHVGKYACMHIFVCTAASPEKTIVTIECVCVCVCVCSAFT